MLFLDHALAGEVKATLSRVRILVRRAKRFTCKSESKTGITAHVSLHEAEQTIAAALKKMGAP